MFKNISVWLVATSIHLGIAWYSFNTGFELGKKKMYEKLLFFSIQSKSLKEA